MRMRVELERVPNPAQRSRSEEKHTLNKLNTLYYPGSIFLDTLWGSQALISKAQAQPEPETQSPMKLETWTF